MKIITVLGARPQFIKAAPFSKALRSRPETVEKIIHTGQHFDYNMSRIFFDEMGIPEPDFNLNINQLSHGAMTGRMLEQIEAILIKEKPDLTVVFGDTNSTIAGSLAAAKLHIPVAHVEAGLRSFDMRMPEEINRILTDRISNLLFCPTETAVKNLQKEGMPAFETQKIVFTGDIMYDSVLMFKEKMKPVQAELPSRFILATIHRQENTDTPGRLPKIIDALNRVHREHMPVVMPLHPRTKKYLDKYGLQPQFITIPPVSYLEMLWLLDLAALVITDSGGLQKEAYFFKKFCITMRDTTEWVELVESGNNVLMDFKEDIYEQIIRHLNRQVRFDPDLYGDGRASEKMVEKILAFPGL